MEQHCDGIVIVNIVLELDAELPFRFRIDMYAKLELGVELPGEHQGSGIAPRPTGRKSTPGSRGRGAAAADARASSNRSKTLINGEWSADPSACSVVS